MRQEYTKEKRQSLQQVVLGKLDSCMYAVPSGEPPPRQRPGASSGVRADGV